MIIGTAKRMVRNGDLDLSVLDRTPKKAEKPATVDLVAAIWNALPAPTLAQCGTQLERQRAPTPRGGKRLSPSSVKNVLDRAKAEGLISATPIEP